MTDETNDLIEDAPLMEALGERYLAYALSTIMHRALPDVRDGLKPVHRRLLYAMRQMRLDPAGSYKKSAKIVGEVMGNFHPHGDQAIYDALVRLVQDFAQRYPLIDGQGNFGNIDGDNAAAMRYTESRMTPVAEALLEGIDENTVDFRATYDGEGEEPTVLPAAFPNLLANGAAGIAVGMATNVPPHNVQEICEALLYLLKTPGASVEKLVSFIPGPDFPTGGTIIDDAETILDAYKTGKGGFRVRAKWHVEERPRGGYFIIVTEIPYQVQKSKLIERIADLLTTRKLPLLGDVRDESTEEIRLVLEPKNRSVDAAVLMESLFKLTDLQNRFPLNMNVLGADQVPRVMDLGEVLRAFLDHRRDVLLRRSRYRLEKIDHRLEVLGGYLIAYLNLDEVIRIIREEDEPKKELMATFELTDVQAEAILNMRLRSLRKLEEMEIKKENKALKAEKKDLQALFKSPELQDKKLGDEIRAIRERFGSKAPGGQRRTDFVTPPELDIDPFEVLTEKEPITVICSQKGWIRTMKGHQPPETEVKYKEGDEGRFFVHAQTTDKLVIFASNGKFYTVGCDKLPGGRGHGEPLRLMIDLGNDDELVTLTVHDPFRELLLASSSGHGFRIREDEVIATKRGGKQVLNPMEGAEAKICLEIEGDTVAVIGDTGKLVCFPLEEVPRMARGKGVILQKYTGNDGGLSDVAVFKLTDGLTVDLGPNRKKVFDLTDWLGARAQRGKLRPKGFPASNRFRLPI